GPELVETVTLPGAPFTLDGAQAAAAQRALELLHLIAGVSYYKAAVPGAIHIDDYAIDAETAALLEDIYLNGLGEFAYRNGLDLHGRISFPASKPSPSRGGLGGDGVDGGDSAVSGTAGKHHPHPSPPGPQAQPSGVRSNADRWSAGARPHPLEGEGARASLLKLCPHALVAIGGG